MGALDEMQDRLERLGEEPERFAHREAAAQFPGLHLEPGEEVLVAQEDGAVEPGDLVQLLANRLRMEDVPVRSGVEVRERGDVGGAETVVVAGGAWTVDLLERWGHPVPAQNFRTQLASLALDGATDLPMVHDLVGGFYARPESDNTMLAGDGTQLRPFAADDYDEAADPEFIQSISQRVVRRLERGGEARLRRGWAGLCVATPDRRALCGAVPDADGLFVLTGDNGFGVMRCLGLGERLADAVGGRPDAALEPGRFGADVLDGFEMREGFAW